MKKYAVTGLLTVVLLSALLRLLPITRYEFWGVDTGEYFGIARTLYVTGHINPTGYSGFGFTYPYFPGIYMTIASAAGIAGIDFYYSFITIVPLIGAFTLSIVFLLSFSLFRREPAALFASFFVASAAIHVLQTSRTMPATLGHFLMVFCLLLLLKSYENRFMFIPLTAATAALVMTHHLSVYFLIVGVFGIALYQCSVAGNSSYPAKISLLYLAILSTVATLFWFGSAAPFVSDVIQPALGSLPVYILPVGLYAGIIVLYVILRLRMHAIARGGLRYKPRYRKLAWNYPMVVVSVAIGMSVLAWLAFFGVSNISPADKGLMLMFVPTALMIGFVGVGVCYADLNRHGFFLYGLVTGIGLSFLYAVVSDSHEIFPDRHAEIIMVATGILIGYGIYKMFQMVDLTTGFKTKAAAFGTVVMLLSLMALTSHPPNAVLGGGEQGTKTEDIGGVLWLKRKISVAEDGAVAAENRLSSVIYGIGGHNSSWYSAEDAFFSPNFTSARDEMIACDCPSGVKRIDYVFLDDATIECAILKPWEPRRAITGDALAKFDGTPYIKIFENGYCVVYAVDWGYA